MSLRDIFNSIVDYDLSGIIEIGLIILFIIFMIGIAIWLVLQILEIKKEFKEKPIRSSISLVFFSAFLLTIPFTLYVLLFMVDR